MFRIIIFQFLSSIGDSYIVQIDLWENLFTYVKTNIFPMEDKFINDFHANFHNVRTIYSANLYTHATKIIVVAKKCKTDDYEIE